MNFEQVMDIYISLKCRSTKEKSATVNLLKNKVLKQFKEDVGNIEIENIQQSQQLKDRVRICFVDSLQLETRSKFKTSERLLQFGYYLKDTHNIDLELDSELPRFFDNKIERQIDLLKTLHSTNRIEDLKAYYNLSDKPLRSELEDLECGTAILGQHVQIERITTPRGEVQFVSTVHPIFLTLNLTEIIALTTMLKQVGENTLMEDIYNHLANNIYTQLSPYAKEKVDSMEKSSHNLLYRDIKLAYRKEDIMTKMSTTDTLLHSLKSKQKIHVIYTEEGIEKELEGYVSQYDMENHEVFIKQKRDNINLYRLKQEDIIAAWNIICKKGSSAPRKRR